MKIPYNQTYAPPAPVIALWVAAPETAITVGPITALVDTGADGTIVPLRHIEPLLVQIDNRKYLRDPWGRRRAVDVYLLDILIDNSRFPLIEVVADEHVEEVLLGRNVLNKLDLVLRGGQQVLEILGL